LLAACGRIDFAARAIDAVTGHDEDGDGVPDSIDVCPHIPDPAQLDSDGDGIGDVCDPEPDNPRQHLALFATMQPGDQPIELFGTGTWTQEADSVHFDGDQDGDLGLVFSATNVRIAIGFDVEQVVGDASLQHQVSLGYDLGTVPYYFVELDQEGAFEAADVTYFDGTGFDEVATTPLPNGVHPGLVMEQVTMVGGASPSAALDGGWTDEPYHESVNAPGFTGGVQMAATINNLVADVSYVWIVAW
jgi:hypothetical protein